MSFFPYDEEVPIPTAKERRRFRELRRKLGAVEMVRAPTPFVCAAGSEYTGDVFIWDLDKTYLRSEFSSLRGLLRTAFERGRDKVAYPGASALLRTLRRKPDGSIRPIYFVSASPPQMGERILEKFAVDGVEIDGIYFKDNLLNVRPGRFQRLREQMGYKLLALIDLRCRLPSGAVEVTFGDDSENDPAVYAVYSEILRGRLRGTQLARMLSKQGVNPDEAVKIAWRARKIPPRPAVRRMFIRVHRKLDARYYRRFGLDVVPTRSAFQAAVVLMLEGTIGKEGFTEVCEELLRGTDFGPMAIVSELHELHRQHTLNEDQLDFVMAWLKTVRVIQG